jgi:hypothetical protein
VDDTTSAPQDPDTQLRHSHLYLLRRARRFRGLLRLRGPSAQRVLEIAIHRVIHLPLSFREREHVQVERLPSRPEVLALPLLERTVGFEIAEVLEVEALVLAVQLGGTLFPSLDNGFDIAVDQEAVSGVLTVSLSAFRNHLLVRRIDDLLSALRNHLEKLVFARGWAGGAVNSNQGNQGNVTCPALTFGLLCSTLLNNELIETELLRSTLEHALLNAIFRYEPENIHLLRLSDTVRTIHRLQVGLWIPGPTVRVNSQQQKKELHKTYQSLSYRTTISAVVKLIPRPPARVVSKKMNFSLPGLLYSSIARIRSS